MTRNISIRLRLTLWYSGVLLLGLVVFGAGLWLSLQHRLLTGIDARLAQRVEGLRTLLGIEAAGMDRKQLEEELSEFTREIPEGGLIQLNDGTGPLLPPARGQLAFPKHAVESRPVYRYELLNGQSYRVLVTRLSQGGTAYDVLVAGSMDELDTVMRDFLQLLLWMIPGVLAVACFGGYWISRRALAPVDEITRVARSISVQNLANRLVVPRTGDEIQRMSETWNDVLERLDSAVRRIRQFTADASHELRTPLALIRATAELTLRRERKQGEYQRALIEIQMEAERMTELTESLLSLARADSAAALPLSRTDLNEIIQEVVRKSEAVAEAKGVVLKTDGSDRPAIAEANPSAIRRLLLALIDNALKHTPPGGIVTVSAAPSNDCVVLRVEDTGEGIPVDALPHIFERFFRADTARSSGSGVGLGLSIAQAIAQAHGSRIAVASEPGAGARFELSLRNGS